MSSRRITVFDTTLRDGDRVERVGAGVNGIGQRAGNAALEEGVMADEGRVVSIHELIQEVTVT